MKVELHMNVRAYLEIRDPAVGLPVIWAKPARSPESVEMPAEMMSRYHAAMNGFHDMQDEIWQLFANTSPDEVGGIRLA
ncbi:MAG: hypothetical protein M3Y05_02285 [Gemmatimonadota bacterium]|nr:hypothetical protein [Gemmatimonadota bacterium]